jgi:hypothetical protein
MSRALAVLLASAALALAPAASATTHPASSHKPAHKPAHAEAPAKGRGKTHAAKASAKTPAGARHRKGVDAEEAQAKPSKKSRHGKAAPDGDVAEAAPHGKGARRHGKAAAEEIETSAPSKRHGRSIVEEADASISARGSHGRGEEGERGIVIRTDLKTTKACVAAHVRAHGRPKGSRARIALQRECAKEVEAARRKAEEEAAIRTWMPPHGPLIYQGAMPQKEPQNASVSDPQATLASNAVSEPAPGATPGASVTIPSDTSASPPAAPDGTPKGPPAASATVAQPPQPAQAGFFAGLFGHGRKARPTVTGPAPTLAALVGADEARLKAELGEPELMRTEGDGALWTYRLPSCALTVFLTRDATTAARGWKVKGAQAGPLKRGGTTPDVDVCLKGARS